MSQPHSLQKTRSRTNWAVQIGLGVVLTVLGLGIGFSIPQQLFVEASLSEDQLLIELNTSPVATPFGRVEFWLSVDGADWHLKSTDDAGFDGWQLASDQNVESTFQVRAVMTDLLGQTHQTQSTFFKQSAIQSSAENALLGLNEAFPLLIESLIAGDFQTRSKIAVWMGYTGDERFLSYLTETLQFSQADDIQEALKTLSGQSFTGGKALRQWYEWLWAQPLALDESFFDWKRRLFAHEVPAMQPLLSEKGSLDWRVVVWGGVPPGGIPPLKNPSTFTATEADFLQPNDIVFGAVINGEARAYPVRMMDWHELANDELGGEFAVLSYCPLCGSAVLFNRRVGETVYSFNTSGLLYESNKLMYDEQTMSLWPNVIGKPLAGALAGSGMVLERFPLTTTTWENWVAMHPNTDVLDPSGNGLLNYETHEAYDLYRVSRDTLAPVSVSDDRLAAKDWVFGLVLDDQATAYAVRELEAQGIWNDQIGSQTLVILADPLPGSQFGFYPATVRAFERRDFVFVKSNEGISDQHGMLWTLTEEALISASGERLSRIYGETTYWFSWSAFHLETDLKLLHPEA